MLYRGHELNALKPTLEQMKDVDETVRDMMTYKGTNLTAEQIDAMDGVNRALSSALSIIILAVPPSADRSAAVRKIREARMDCNSAIVHGGKY